ncbi:hypothetical protein Ancab_035701, partial [Ancistrocladus abbreviatus]
GGGDGCLFDGRTSIVVGGCVVEGLHGYNDSTGWMLINMHGRVKGHGEGDYGGFVAGDDAHD